MITRGSNGGGPEFGSSAASRFAALALQCVHREYPNKIAHVLNSDSDVAPPRKLTPAFYGCFDWHSAVHGHWLLARLARMFPQAEFAGLARAALQKNLTAANIAQEVAYLTRPGNANFQRPYGLAWLLQLALELREWNEAPAPELAANLRPLEKAAVERISAWLPKLPRPIRTGEHNQTAFGLGLMLDYAQGTGSHPFAELLASRARAFYLADRASPLAYEPSGEDFLSPALGEADLMRRVLDAGDFALWLHGFMPQLPQDGNPEWLRPAVSPDPSDPKLAHLDGLNLSRAWMLEGIGSVLPLEDARQDALRAAARAHRDAGLAAVTGEHYEGGHWLGSFAVYLVSGRGIRPT